MENKIQLIKAKDILDSRGNPAIEVELITDSPSGEKSFLASVPSGASTGKNEAVELRDEDGKGVNKAIQNINEIIAPKIIGKDPTNQKEIDQLLIDLDGTENKSRLGANALLAVSIAVCRAGAGAENLPLYKYINKSLNLKSQNLKLKIPFPMFNILNGGAHIRSLGLKNHLDIQEFMIVPQKKSFAENLELAKTITNNLKEILIKQFGESFVIGDEGGYAPAISKTREALNFLKEAIGENNSIKIALDCAASEFFNNEKYLLENKEFSKEELLNFYKDLVSKFEIISLEDPFSEENWEGFAKIKKELSEIIIVGDDLTTTNIKRIKEAQEKKACNAVIIKPNQIGTVTEAIAAAILAKSYNWKIIVSHRSGETMDDFISDFAVGISADFIKAGAYTKPERMVKYDRLLEIEKELRSGNSF